MGKAKESFIKTHPKLLKYWNYEKNNKLGYYPENYGIGSHQKVWWICEKGHEWESAVYHIKDRNCPYCSRKRTIVGENDLTTTNPELMKEWDYDKNIISPNELFATSHKKVWWTCKDGHEWESAVYQRAIKNHNCPICSNQMIVSGINDLQALNPKLITEWNYEKNTISPKTISLNYSKKVWWKDSYGHEWEDTVNHRNQGRGCPICSNKQILQGFNDLKTTNLDIAKEWHPTKNGTLKPTDVTIGSHKKMWWKCSSCNNEWESVIYSRKNCGCPRCQESKGEKEISRILNKYNINYQTQYRFNDCRSKNPLPFDFAIFDNEKLTYLIEYDGEQHFKESTMNNRESLKEIQKRDTIKSNYCKNNQIRLIRISYKDFNHIENILKRIIN